MKSKHLLLSVIAVPFLSIGCDGAELRSPTAVAKPGDSKTAACSGPECSELGDGDGDGDGGPSGETSAGTGGAGTTSSGGSLSTGSGSSTSGSGGTAPVMCSNELPDAGEGWETCDDWAEWGHCNDEWMTGKCNQSCQRCEVETPGDGDGDGDGGDNPPVWTGENPYDPITNGEQTYSTRYWDCCKPSCGWSSRPNTVDSCDLNGNNIGVNDDVRSACEGGQAQTCHGMAPWAVSDNLSFGYVAANGRTCGSCYQLQFTGQGEYDSDEIGSRAIQGKTMIVMVTNTGGELGDGHFDILIPGGGLGAFNGCSAATGIPAGELGAQYGGFIEDCRSQGSLEARKSCVRNKCTSVFGSRGLDDLEAGCLWHVDWFETADNPRFMFQEVECPGELQGYN